MKYINHAKHIEVNGNIWAVDSRYTGCYTYMLKPMINQLDCMLSHHSKVLMIRFDLHCREFKSDNSDISEFNRRLFRRLKTDYKLTRIGFIWVREQEKSNQHHYHYVLLLDGHKVQKSYAVLRWVEAIWDNIGSHYWMPKRCYLMIQRGNIQKKQKAIWRISYFSKGRGKGKRPPQTKDYSTSRIKMKASDC